jgi:pimeloyl-ACP methyl ester carboxylesterase
VLGKDAFERSFSSVFGPGTKPGPEQLERFWDLIARDGGRALFHRGMSYMAERRENRERWVGAIVRSPCPVLLVNGSADPVSGAHMIARYREVVPRKDPVVELPSIGHYPQVEAPGRVVASLGPFWESVEG